MPKVDEAVANIQKEVRNLFKNIPVSARNADKHLLAAWELEQAAHAIRDRVRKRAKPLAAASQVKTG